MKLCTPAWLVAAAAVVLSASHTVAVPAGDQLSAAVARDHAAIAKRGEIHDIIGTISRKGQCGRDFCSTFLHVQPTTKTVTVTKTVEGTRVPSSTLVRTTAITRTASPALTRTRSLLSVVAVTPTVKQTIVRTIPVTSTVTAVTSFVTQTATSFVSTYTSFVDQPVPRNNKARIPDWLKPHCETPISKACSRFVSTKTCTKTKTVTKTKNCTKGVATVVKTNTVAITPTTTITVVRTSTSTAAPVTSTVKLTTSSLVPVTDTVVGTKVETITAVSTVVVTRPVSSTTTTSSSTTTTTSSSTTTSTTTTESSSTTTSSTTSSTTTTTTPTPTAPIDVQGYIRLVRASDQSAYGFVAAGNGAYGGSPVTQDSSEALLTFLSSTVLASGGSLLDLPIVNAQTYKYFGATQLANSGNGDLAQGSSNYATVANVDQTAPGEQGDGGTSYGGGVYESSIWNYNSVTGQITGTWTNSDGSPINVQILGLQASSYFYLTPDPAAFKQTYGSFDTVEAYFVSSV